MSDTVKPGQRRILLIEDEADIATFISLELGYEGYHVDVAHDGQKGLMMARQTAPDLIILDRMLPGLDGIEICKRLRQSSDVPILMLTAKGEPADRVFGLDAGANDYLVKPFDLEELLARVRVQLRSKQSDEKSSFHFADLSLAVETRLVMRGTRAVSLSPKEFDLLLFFMHHPRVVLGRERLLAAVWGYDFGGEDNVLEVYVRYVRQKLEAGGEARLLHTVRGVGYVFREADPA
ncbi:MAG: response regulator transcription factor [Candidatus Sericytochromatia bacterium]|nr:response regulator transcription factor [Candidatus Sericytochromatia bacterium]